MTDTVLKLDSLRLLTQQIRHKERIRTTSKETAQNVAQRRKGTNTM